MLNLKKSTIVISILASVNAYAMDKNSCGNLNEEGKCIYNPDIAVEYAQKYAKIVVPRFQDYTNYPNGGNCTNFVSQAILAGLVGSSNVDEVYRKRLNYVVDNNPKSDYKWYFKSDGNRGEAWTGASQLYEYARRNIKTYNGFHFDFVTQDSSSEPLNFKQIKKGDVIFVNWDSKKDSEIDHAMIVVDISSRNYRGVKVAYQSDYEGGRKNNVSLESINSRNTIFYVYRPTFYWERGL